ncbi:AEC family transporter [Oceanibium sediminis]|uniref:AEC family transporter n=1 Tax=Oceanibium sediminis TaxID=2026339 RepID=UPI000DD48BB9|nr:AEC family transporter [Oceanibium sediminis]
MARQRRGGVMQQIVSVLADPILPVFAIMALGFLVGRNGWVSGDEARVLNRFAMTLLLPILVFDLVVSAPIRSVSPVPLMIYAAAEVIVFTLGYQLAGRAFQRPADEAVLLGFAGIFANNALYVLPISVLLYGEAHVLPIASVIAMDSIIAFGGAMLALGLIRAGSVTPLVVAGTVLRTPITQGILLGLAINLAGLELPAPVQTFVDFNGGAAGPVALLALGVVMCSTRFRPDATVWTFTLIKLVLFPVLVWLGLIGLAPAGEDYGQYLLASAGPAGAMAFSMALLHGVRTDAISQVVVYTSVLTLGTLALLA